MATFVIEQFPERLGNQLRLYDSRVRTAEKQTTILDCWIVGYRQQQRRAGVPITVRSPCDPDARAPGRREFDRA